MNHFRFQTNAATDWHEVVKLLTILVSISYKIQISRIRDGEIERARIEDHIVSS